jgi:uncharacterized membrane protein
MIFLTYMPHFYTRRQTHHWINFAFPFTKLQYKLLIKLSQIYNCAVKNSNYLNIVTATDLKV